MKICTIITEDWVDAHLVRWLRYVKKNCVGWERYLYYLGDRRDEKFPWLKAEFTGIIDLPHEGRPQYNLIRMGAYKDFGGDILYCDADADIIGNIDDIKGCTANIAFCKSPRIHGEWTRLCLENKWDWTDWEGNNGLLYMRRDYTDDYLKATEAVKSLTPRIQGTMVFNYMVRKLTDGYAILSDDMGVIWWDVEHHVGAKIVQYCNDKGQAKRRMLEKLWRDAWWDSSEPDGKRISRMRGDPKQSAGLHDLCRRVKELNPDAKTLVEIGGYAGESAEIFSKYFDKVWTIDPWVKYDEPFHAAQTMGDHVYQMFLQRTLPLKNVQAVRASSPEAASTFADGLFDVVYIDGNHDYEHITADIKAWVPKIKAGGILAGHDYQHDPVKQAVAEFADQLTVESFDDNSWLIHLR